MWERSLRRCRCTKSIVRRSEAQEIPILMQLRFQVGACPSERMLLLGFTLPEVHREPRFMLGF